MKKIILFLLFISVISCSKPKTVFICGDHVCVNKAEAQQYFEENLTLEVKVLKNKDSHELSLIELNLKDPNLENKQIYVKQKTRTDKKIKKLTTDEKKKIISKIKKKKNTEKIVSKSELKAKKKISLKDNKQSLISKKVKNKKDKTLDICKILKECTIDEISKYLIKEGKERSFPDITTRQ